MQANIETAMLYYGLVEKRRAEPKDDLFSKLIAAELEREDGQKTRLDDLEIAAFSTLLGAAGAETVTKLVGNAVYMFAKNPDQWQRLLDDRSKIPAAVEELLRYEAPAQYNVRVSMKEVKLHGVTIPEGQPVFLIGGSANRDLWHGPMRTSSTSTGTAPRRRTSVSAMAFTAAWARPWRAWRARSRWRSCSTSCRDTKSTSTTADASRCKTSSAGRTSR